MVTTTGRDDCLGRAGIGRAVDRLYQRTAFASGAGRVALLFTRHQALTNG